MNIHRQIFRHIGLFLLLFCGFTNWVLAQKCDKWEQGQWKFQDSLENLKLHGLSNNLFYLKAALPNNEPYLIFETTGTSCDVLRWETASGVASKSGVAVHAEPYGYKFGVYPQELFEPLKILKNDRSKVIYTYQLPSLNPLHELQPLSKKDLYLNRFLKYVVTIELTPFGTSTKCNPTFTPDTTSLENVRYWLKPHFLADGKTVNPLWMGASNLDHCTGYKVQINLKAYQIAGTKSDTTVQCPTNLPFNCSFFHMWLRSISMRSQAGST